MTFEQLRIFVAVAERQHVTRAAETLNLVQSAASHAIAALEAQYATKLFNRVGRRVELTEVGVGLLADARTILAQVQHAEAGLNEFEKLERGTLRVMASQTIAGYWLPRYLVAFCQTYPGISIRLEIGNTAHVAEAVERGAVDLGFGEGVVSAPMLHSTQVARDQLVIVVGRLHAWTDGRRIRPSALPSTDWVLREKGSGTRSAFEHALKQIGVDSAQLNVALELPSNEAVRAAVETGHGATAVSASVAAPSIEAGLLYHVPIKLPERSYYAIHHKDRAISPAGRALLALLPAKGGSRRRADVEAGRRSRRTPRS